VSFSHAGRCRNDAAFARLAGTSPIEASSGQTTRHRLNRGGDRALNKAIHVIANTRIRTDAATPYLPESTANVRYQQAPLRSIRTGQTKHSVITGTIR
jgi:transposase